MYSSRAMIRWYSSNASRSPCWARAQRASLESAWPAWNDGWAYCGARCCWAAMYWSICSIRSSIFLIRRPNSPALTNFSGSRVSCSGVTVPAVCSPVSEGAVCSGSWPACSSATMGSFQVLFRFLDDLVARSELLVDPGLRLPHRQRRGGVRVLAGLLELLAEELAKLLGGFLGEVATGGVLVHHALSFILSMTIWGCATANRRPWIYPRVNSIADPVWIRSSINSTSFFSMYPRCRSQPGVRISSENRCMSWTHFSRSPSGSRSLMAIVQPASLLVRARGARLH